jgi:hypothetical protein
MPDLVLQLFLCPYCNKYTIHLPRISLDGRILVDHKMVLEQLFDGVDVAIPYNYCEIKALDIINLDLFTRTVIRV